WSSCPRRSAPRARSTRPWRSTGRCRRRRRRPRAARCPARARPDRPCATGDRRPRPRRVNVAPMADTTDGEPGVAQVRALLESEGVGLLSTSSVHRAASPYGSLTPFALSASGAPLLLLSGLAAHTKNLLADPRACLFVGDRTAAEDPLAGARVSLLGRAARVPAADDADARARYLERWPRAEAYFQLRAFALRARPVA